VAVQSGVRACRVGIKLATRTIAQENERRKSVGIDAWVSLSYPGFEVAIFSWREFWSPDPAPENRSRFPNHGFSQHVLLFPLDNVAPCPGGLSVCSRPPFLELRFAQWHCTGVSVSSSPPFLPSREKLASRLSRNPGKGVKRFV
jgi:hypothetical protein